MSRFSASWVVIGRSRQIGYFKNRQTCELSLSTAKQMRCYFIEPSCWVEKTQWKKTPVTQKNIKPKNKLVRINRVELKTTWIMNDTWAAAKLVVGGGLSHELKKTRISVSLRPKFAKIKQGKAVERTVEVQIFRTNTHLLPLFTLRNVCRKVFDYQTPFPKNNWLLKSNIFDAWNLTDYQSLKKSDTF